MKERMKVGQEAGSALSPGRGVVTQGPGRENRWSSFLQARSLHVHCNHLPKFNSYRISKKSEWILARLEMRTPGLRRLEL